LFTFASLVELGILMVWFGETPSWIARGEWTLRITGVTELSGVSEGTPVNLSGVQIGRVKALEFVNPERPDLGVVIVARIKQQYTVPQGAIAKVYGTALGFGTGHVDIVVEPGVRAEMIDKDFAEIRGEMHNIIRELLTKELVDSLERTITHFGDLAAAAKPVAENLSRLLEERTVAQVTEPDAAKRGLTPNISTVVERLDALAAHINEVLGDENLQADVRSAVGDLKDAAEELRDTVALWKTESQKVADNLNAGIDNTELNLDESFAKLNQVLENLDDATKSMSRLLYQVAEGQGTAGLLARDERLYEAAVLSLERLSELIGTLQRITTKIEQDGHITIGKDTPVGTFTKDFPLAEPAPKPPSR
jgi:ABC-type transporter Mla subunit MlaD